MVMISAMNVLEEIFTFGRKSLMNLTFFWKDRHELMLIR